MNRIDRLSAILIMLRTKKLITAQEISDRFEISLRTVYRDMKALDEAGVPIGAEAGKGYYLVEGYHLPPVMFTSEEAGAMLIAGKLIDSFSDKSVREFYNLALDKIKSVLPAMHQGVLEQMDNNVHVYHNGKADRHTHDSNGLTIIQQALSTKKCLEVRYRSNYKKETTVRIVEPISLCFYGFQWHLIAYCRLRSGFRDFRIDRIQDIQVSNYDFSPRPDFSISKYFHDLWESQELYNVAVRFDKAKISEIQNSRYYFGFYEENVAHDYVEMHFAVTNYEYMANWLMGLGEIVVEILQPELNNLVKKKVEALTAKYINI